MHLVILLLARSITRFTMQNFWLARCPRAKESWTFSSYGDRKFAAAGTRRWNSLLVQLRHPDITHKLFKRQLKGHLFGEPWTWRCVTSDTGRHRKTFTYLLDCIYAFILRLVGKGRWSLSISHSTQQSTPTTSSRLTNVCRYRSGSTLLSTTLSTACSLSTLCTSTEPCRSASTDELQCNMTCNHFSLVSVLLPTVTRVSE